MDELVRRHAGPSFASRPRRYDVPPARNRALASSASVGSWTPSGPAAKSENVRDVVS